MLVQAFYNCFSNIFLFSWLVMSSYFEWSLLDFPGILCDCAVRRRWAETLKRKRRRRWSGARPWTRPREWLCWGTRRLTRRWSVVWSCPTETPSPSSLPLRMTSQRRSLTIWSELAFVALVLSVCHSVFASYFGSFLFFHFYVTSTIFATIDDDIILLPSSSDSI